MTGIYETFGKRAVDIAFSGVGLLTLSPLLALTAAAVRAEDGGPAIFKQNRVGRDGRSFIIYKFRSMPVNATDIPSGDLHAPPITRVGSLIRRTNVDELPQLWNILKGDMSLVGPRPPLPAQTDVISGRSANGCLRLRPGLTGLAQVNSYDGMPAIEKTRLDGEYAEKVSFGIDSGIILRTFKYLTSPPPKY